MNYNTSLLDHKSSDALPPDSNFPAVPIFHTILKHFPTKRQRESICLHLNQSYVYFLITLLCSDNITTAHTASVNKYTHKSDRGHFSPVSDFFSTDSILCTPIIFNSNNFWGFPFLTSGLFRPADHIVCGVEQMLGIHCLHN